MCVIMGEEAQEWQERRAKRDFAVLACRGVSLYCSISCCYTGLLGFGRKVVFFVFPVTEGNVLSEVL